MQRVFQTDPRAPLGRVGVPFSVGAAKVTIKDLRILPGSASVRPPKGAFFLGFTLVIENRSPESVFRMQALLEGLTTPEGRPLVAGSGLNALVDEAILALPEPPGGRSRDDAEIRAGQTLEIPIAKTVPVGTRRAHFVSMLLFRGGSAAQRQLDYKVDLGELPGYSAPTDQRLPIGMRGDLYGIGVKVTRAELAPNAGPSDPGARALIGALEGGGGKASEGEKALLGLFGAAPNGTNKKAGPGKDGSKEPMVLIRVRFEITNPTREPWEVSLNNVVVEDTAGKTYGFDLFRSGDEGGLSTVLPGKTVQGGYIFSVPKSKVSGLKVRFNPSRGYGNIVVPLSLAPA